MCISPSNSAEKGLRAVLLGRSAWLPSAIAFWQFSSGQNGATDAGSGSAYAAQPVTRCSGRAIVRASLSRALARGARDPAGADAGAHGEGNRWLEGVKGSRASALQPYISPVPPQRVGSALATAPGGRTAVLLQQLGQEWAFTEGEAEQHTDGIHRNTCAVRPHCR